MCHFRGSLQFLDKPGNNGGLSGQELVKHEVLEAYRTAKGTKVIKAHLEIPYGGFVGNASDSSLVTTGGNYTGATRVFAITARPTAGNTVVTSEFITPIPVINGLTGKPIPERITNVTKLP